MGVRAVRLAWPAGAPRPRSNCINASARHTNSRTRAQKTREIPDLSSPKSFFSWLRKKLGERIKEGKAAAAAPRGETQFVVVAYSCDFEDGASGSGTVRKNAFARLAPLSLDRG
jgi:hypothetical protein